MTNEERKLAILNLWHDIAEDRSLQVSLRLKASEYEAKALGLIGDQPGIAIDQGPDVATEQLRKLTIEQLEAIAKASDAEIVEPKKTTAPEPPKEPAKPKVDTTPTSAAKTPVKAQETPNTATAPKGAAK